MSVLLSGSRAPSSFWVWTVYSAEAVPAVRVWAEVVMTSLATSSWTAIVTPVPVSVLVPVVTP